MDFKYGESERDLDIIDHPRLVPESRYMLETYDGGGERALYITMQNATLTMGQSNYVWKKLDGCQSLIDFI